MKIRAFERWLAQILNECSHKPIPAGPEDLAKVIDDLVAAQKKFRGLLLTNCKRLGVLPAGK